MMVVYVGIAYGPLYIYFYIIVLLKTNIFYESIKLNDIIK